MRWQSRALRACLTTRAIEEFTFISICSFRTPGEPKSPTSAQAMALEPESTEARRVLIGSSWAAQIGLFQSGIQYRTNKNCAENEVPPSPLFPRQIEEPAMSDIATITPGRRLSVVAIATARTTSTREWHVLDFST